MSRNIHIPLLVSVVMVVVLAVGGLQTGYGQEAPPTFPESHKDFLGAASYQALFGLEAEHVEPGPHSSDTGTGRPPRVGPNTRVNDPQQPFPDGLLGRSETSVAASNNGNQLVAGWNDADGFCGPPFGVPCTPPDDPGLSGFGFSADGGQTWTDGGAPLVFTAPDANGDPRGVITRGDPSLATAGAGGGSFYYANLAVFTEGPFSPVEGFFGTAGVSVHRGDFQATTFNWDSGSLAQAPNFPRDFLDKEHVAAQRRGNRDNVYVTVTNFIEVDGIPFFGFGQIEAYSSTDSADTWGVSIIQPDETVSVPANIGVVNQGSQPAVAPDGTIYVAWERGWLFPFFGGFVTPEIRVAKSTDNGVTWSPVDPGASPSGADVAGSLVSKICSGALFPPAGYNRNTHNDFPRIAVAQDGPNRGRVYVVYQDCRIANGGSQEATGGLGDPDLDVYLSSSDDGGATWSDPTLIAGGGDGLIQFWPTVSVQPDGNVDVTYYESEEPEGTPLLGGDPEDPDNPDQSLVDLFWAQSIDGGESFKDPVRVTEVTTDWGATATNIIPNFGDYNTAVSAGNRLFATWADGRNGVPDTFFAKVLTGGKAPR